MLAAIKIAGTTTFLTGIGGTTLITSGGIVAGTTVAGLKMAKRTGGVEVFRFLPIQGNRNRNVIISVTGWITSKEGKGKNVPKARRKSTTASQEADLNATGSGSERDRSTSSASRVTDISVGGTSSTTAASSSSTQKTESEVREEDQEQDPEEAIANGLEDLVVPFMGVSPVMGSHYALCFDPHILKTLGDALKIFASEIISFSAQQVLQQTILSIMLSALNWPLWLLKLGYLVDNPWSLGLDRARKSGQILADALCNNVHDGRPVTLVGYSLGARVIYYCLLELAQRGKYGIVEDVYMLGAPVLIPRSTPQGKARPAGDLFQHDITTPIDVESLYQNSPNALKSLDEWRMVTSVVGGRLVNCFSRSDWVLGFLFRASVAGMWDVAGLQPVILDEETTPEVVVMTDEKGDFSAEPSKGASAPAGTKKAAGFRPPTMSVAQSMSTGLAGTSSVPTTPYVVNPEEEEQKESESNGDRVGDKAWRQLTGKAAVVYNVDITAMVPGHLSYRTAMPAVLKRVCGFECWADDIEVIEEIVKGSWMEDVDGWWKDDQDRQKDQRRRMKKKKKEEKKETEVSSDSRAGPSSLVVQQRQSPMPNRTSALGTPVVSQGQGTFSSAMDIANAPHLDPHMQSNLPDFVPGLDITQPIPTVSGSKRHSSSSPSNSKRVI